MKCPSCGMTGNHRNNCGLGGTPIKSKRIQGVPVIALESDIHEYTMKTLTGVGPQGVMLQVGKYQGNWAFKIEVKMDDTIIPIVVTGSTTGFENKDAAIGMAKQYYMQHYMKLMRKPYVLQEVS